VRRAALAAVVAAGLLAGGCGGSGSGGGGGSNGSSGTPVNGGTLRAGIPDNPDYLDPGLSYTNEGWEILEATNNGLLTFKKAANPNSSRLTWRFSKGPVQVAFNFGDPFTTDSYTVCSAWLLQRGWFRARWAWLLS